MYNKVARLKNNYSVNVFGELPGKGTMLLNGMVVGVRGGNPKNVLIAMGQKIFTEEGTKSKILKF